MKPRSLKSFLFIAIFAMWFCAADVAQACPTCRDGLMNDQGNMIQAYFWSIIFMMSMPFLIFSGLGGYFYYLIVKARAEQVAGDSLLANTHSATAHSAKTTDAGLVRHGAMAASGVSLNV